MKPSLTALLCVASVLTSTGFAVDAPQTEGTENTSSASVDSQEMGEVKMSVTNESGFRPNTVSSATLTNMSLEEVPQTVNVITKDLIEARGSTDLVSALQMDSSVYTGGDSFMSNTAGLYNVRGFRGTQATVNGVPLTTTMGYGLDTSILQNIEVVKGPIGSISGGQTSSGAANGAGGSINLVVKRPEFENKTGFLSFARMDAEGGQKYRVEVDHQTSQGSEEEGGISFRAIVSAEYERPFWLSGGANGGQKYSVTPMVRWQHDKNTVSYLTLSYQYSNAPLNQGVPVLEGRVIGDYDAWYGSPFARSNVKSFLAMYDFEKKFNHVWTFKTGASMNFSSLDYNIWGLSRVRKGMNVMDYYADMIANGTAVLEGSWQDRDQTTWNYYANGLAEFSTGAIKHEALVGVNYIGRDTRGNGQRASTNYTINIYEPTAPRPLDRTYTNATGTDTTLQTLGFLAQDALFYKEWIMLAGVRGDAHFSDQGSYKFAFSPRAGVTRKFGDRYALFGNWSRTSSPNFGYESGPNEELTSIWNADQVEFGARFRPCDNVWLSASWFQIRQENTPTLDSDGLYYYSEGGRKSQGVEISLNGNITENWSSYLSYTYTRATDLTTGESYAVAPPNAVSLWQKYRISGETLLNNWVFGLGYRYRDSYFATNQGKKIADNYTVPSYGVFDFTLEIPAPESWGIHKGQFKVGVYNIFNKQYIQSIRHAVQGFVGAPRTFEIGFSGEF